MNGSANLRRTAHIVRDAEYKRNLFGMYSIPVGIRLMSIDIAFERQVHRVPM
jgi:hypothetical protein